MLAQKLLEIENFLKKYAFDEAYDCYQKHLNIIPAAQFFKLKKEYEKKKVIAEQEKVLQKPKIELKIRHLLSIYDFIGAQMLYDEFIGVISETMYQTEFNTAKEKLCKEKLAYISELFQNYKFERADEYYRDNKNYITVVQYDSTRNQYLKKQFREKLKKMLEENQFDKFDALVRTNNLLDNQECINLKVDYVGSALSGLLSIKLNRNEEISIAASLVEKEEQLPTHPLSAEDSILFIYKYLNPEQFSLELVISIIDVMLSSRTGNTSLWKEEIVLTIVKKGLASGITNGTAAESIWKILCHVPNGLIELAESSKELIDKIGNCYPWDKFNKIGRFYIPPEEDFFRFVVKNKDRVLVDTDGDINNAIKKQNYFNCKLIYKLIRTEKEYPEKNLKDILDCLTEIINESFGYNIENNSQFTNLIFPSCVSDEGSKNFSILKRENIFCEGSRITTTDSSGKQIVMCRNNKCNARTIALRNEEKLKNEYFVNFLGYYFDISAEMLFGTQNFSRCMGALNRGNEILKHLFCGYNELDGCHSALKFQKKHQVQSGFAAYATTFWHCSNQSCKKQTQTIKLSHCKGCGKIIDSRIDTHHCHRNDGKEFYICIRCGYCCNQHDVNGICPNCGINDEWKPVGEWGSWYQCRNCGHKIKVPPRFNGCLDKRVDIKSKFIRTENIGSDDIPF